MKHRERERTERRERERGKEEGTEIEGKVKKIKGAIGQKRAYIKRKR